MPLSGDLGFRGEATLAGVEAAAVEVNAYLEGIGHALRFNILTRETVTDRVVALEQLKEMPSLGVQVVIGPR